MTPPLKIITIDVEDKLDKFALKRIRDNKKTRIMLKVKHHLIPFYLDARDLIG